MKLFFLLGFFEQKEIIFLLIIKYCQQLFIKKGGINYCGGSAIMAGGSPIMAGFSIRALSYFLCLLCLVGIAGYVDFISPNNRFLAAQILDHTC